MSIKVKLSKHNFEHLKMLADESGQRPDDYLNGILVGVFTLESMHHQLQNANPAHVARLVADICGTA